MLNFPELNISTGDTVAILALVISMCNTIATFRFNREQKQFMGQQKELNSIMLRRESDEATDKTKACICAKIVDYGNYNKKLIIYNQGKSVARNVRITFPSGNKCVLRSDIKEKFPLKTLQPDGNVQLIIVQDTETEPKFSIEVHWDDDFEVNHKELIEIIL